MLEIFTKNFQNERWAQRKGTRFDLFFSPIFKLLIPVFYSCFSKHITFLSTLPLGQKIWKIQFWIWTMLFFSTIWPIKTHHCCINIVVNDAQLDPALFTSRHHNTIPNIQIRLAIKLPTTNAHRHYHGRATDACTKPSALHTLPVHHQIMQQLFVYFTQLQIKWPHTSFSAWKPTSASS